MTALDRLDIVLLMEWAKLPPDKRQAALAYLRQLAKPAGATDPTGN
jgi:hypothetical protein